MTTCVRTSVLPSTSTVQLCTDRCPTMTPNMPTVLSVLRSVHVSELLFIYMQTVWFGLGNCSFQTNVYVHVFNVINNACSRAVYAHK